MLQPLYPEDDEHNQETYQWVEPHRLNPHQVKLREELQRLRPLGLRLDVSSLFPRNLYPTLEVGPQAEKVKAASVPARTLKIGSWQRVTKNPSDLVAKWYFAKRKLVWEILEGRLKSKIEVQWYDIIAINAYIRPNEPGVLQLELKQCPTFHEEADPLPRKHTIWKPASDFTGGQAITCRRHLIIFPPGELDKPYEKLLQYDQRLLLLSQRPFPSLQDPYFPTFGYNPLQASPSMAATQQNLQASPSMAATQQNLQASPSMAATQQYFDYQQMPPLTMENPSPISDNNGGTIWDEQLNNNSGLYPALVTATDYSIGGGIHSNPYSSTPANDYNYSSLSTSYQHQTGSELNNYLSNAIESIGEFYNSQQYQHQQQVFVPDNSDVQLYQQQVFVPDNSDVQLYQQQHHSGMFGNPYSDGGFESRNGAF